MLMYTGTLFTYNILTVSTSCYVEGQNENDKLVSFWKGKKTRSLGKDRPTALMLGRCKPLLRLEKILKSEGCLPRRHILRLLLKIACTTRDLFLMQNHGERPWGLEPGSVCPKGCPQAPL